MSVGHDGIGGSIGASRHCMSDGKECVGIRRSECISCCEVIVVDRKSELLYEPVKVLVGT